MSEPIDVFFEFPSPYSYLAAQQLPALAARNGRTVRWRPVDIAAIWSDLGVLEAYGAVRKVKGAYIRHDAARVAQMAGVPFAPLRRLPDVRLARLANHRLNLEAPEAADAFVLAVWRRLFVDQADITDPAVLQACAPPPAPISSAGRPRVSRPRSRSPTPTPRRWPADASACRG